LPKEKSLTKNRYRFCPPKKNPKKDIGFPNRENFNQERIQVLPIEKNLAKKKYTFFQ
jgi:hypothetical protein